MTWIPTEEFVHPCIWLCRAYYKGKNPSKERQAILNADLEAPSLEYLVAVVLHPEEGRWYRSKTKHGDLQKLSDEEAVDNVIFLIESEFIELDFISNLGHDDSGRMMFYDRRIKPPKEERS